MVRDGRAFGVYFAVTAALVGDVPNKLFNVLTQRVTFTQADPSDYTTIVGRGWGSFNDEPGRGLAVEMVDERPVPLEFQTAIPVLEGSGDAYRTLAQRMAQAWAALEQKDPSLKARRAGPVEPLAALIDLPGVMGTLGSGAPAKAVPLGLNDLDRQPTLIEFGAKGPHWLVVGPPVTGKTTVLRSLVRALAHHDSPKQAALVLVDPSDPSRRFFNFGAGGDDTLDRLPHVLATVTNAANWTRWSSACRPSSTGRHGARGPAGYINPPLHLRDH
jgi:S-DNA-T family DNA segregation ATPase FtsK/SpoIIIE